MKAKSLLVFSLIAILIFSITTIASNDDHSKVRVVAYSKKEASDALANGCALLRDARTLKAFSCSKDVALSLGLQEDIKVFALDAEANNQIGANIVQSSGNTGSGRKVVVVDTGYNYLHPELSSSYLGGYDFVNNDNDPMDDNGHGSHVAGLITGDGVDSRAKGVAPSAGIYSLKVLDASGSGYFSDVIAATYYAADNYSADAISMSLGTSPPYTYKGYCDNVLPSLTDAIKYTRSKGTLVVVAAGNSGGAGVSIPGCISYSTTVGAVDNTDTIARFSGKGNAVDISAPGVSLYSSWLGNNYVTASGTSMATPEVSGTVALIRYAHPGYTVTQVENALFNTAKDLGKKGKDQSYGYGRVDAAKAVTY